MIFIGLEIQLERNYDKIKYVFIKPKYFMVYQKY
jgi:hypothetical protein